MLAPLLALLLMLMVLPFAAHAEERPRPRDVGVTIGVLPTGTHNAITDVAGVKVGQVTLIEGDAVRTGVTAILPHDQNLYQNKVPAAIFVANGFGKLAGSTQVQELGNLETPIVLTNTLSVPAGMEALITQALQEPGNENVRSVNVLVGETNDGGLNDIRGRHVTPQHVLDAIADASDGPVDEGNVGAGTGTICFGFKAGIGTASRKLPDSLGGYTVGVLVQANFGGVLQIDGVRVGEKLAQFSFSSHLPKVSEKPQHPDVIPSEVEGSSRGRGIAPDQAAGRPGLDPSAALGMTGKENGTVGAAHSQDVDGSCMIVVATDAPLDARNLERLAKRAFMGLAKTGGIASNGSGDYVIAFSTAEGLRVPHGPDERTQPIEVLHNDHVSPLFLAAIESTEEAIINALFAAETMTGRDGRTVEALPLEKVLPMLQAETEAE